MRLALPSRQSRVRKPLDSATNGIRQGRTVGGSDTPERLQPTITDFTDKKDNHKNSAILPNQSCGFRLFPR